MIFLGAPGAGKGTQAKVLADRRRWTHISTGDLLRSAVAEGTALGLKAKSFMERGALVPDDVMIGLIREKLPTTGEFVLDGFPRTVPQAEALERMLQDEKRPADAVINLEVEDEDVIRRLSGRRQCKNGHVFHADFFPSKKGETCDRCQEILFQRPDDRAETVRARLEVYHQQTRPLIGFYQNRNRLKNVDGRGSSEDVSRAIDSQLAGGK